MSRTISLEEVARHGQQGFFLLPLLLCYLGDSTRNARPPEVLLACWTDRTERERVRITSITQALGPGCRIVAQCLGIKRHRRLHIETAHLKRVLYHLTP